MNIAILSNGTVNYSTKRLKQVAEERGHKVRIIKYKNCFVSIDKHDPKVIYKGKAIDVKKYDAVIPRIANYMTKYGTSVVRQLEREGIFTTASAIAISRSRDKLRSMQILARHVDVPKTVFSRNSTDIKGIIDELGGTPVIIKLARGTHGNGVVLADSRKTAESALQAFYLYNEDGSNILVQEYIKESAGTDIRAFVVGGRVVASMERKSLDDDFRSNLHQNGKGSPIKLTQEERRAAIKSAKAMGLAVAGVDIMRSERGPLVLEVNASPGFGIEEVTGRDVATPIIEYIEHNLKRGQKKDRVGA
jgi:ribosomal protein S6--L-glutamate ligase